MLILGFDARTIIYIETQQIGRTEMQRRLFLGASAASVPLLLSRSAFAGESDSKSTTQREDGVLIEDVTWDPFKNGPIDSADLHSTEDERRRWALPHITELCKTQTISRGCSNVSIFRRSMQDIDDLKVRAETGHSTLGEFLRRSSTDAFMIMREGKVITEKYFGGMRPRTPHLIWSCSKSIATGVVGNLLQSDSHFARDSVVTNYVPELKGCGYDGCKIDDLLNMRSGIKYRFGLDAEGVLRHRSQNECERHYRSAEMYPRISGDHFGQYDFLKSLGRDEQLGPHGSTFCYKDSDTAVLAWACVKVTGTRFVDLMSDLIWSRLGTEHDGSIIYGPKVACTSAAGVPVTLRDFARCGRMHLQEGTWNGQQLVPSDFVGNVSRYRKIPPFGESSHPPKDILLDGTTYHDQFWINAENMGSFHALGHCGQICYVHPQTETVIVRFTSAQEVAPKYNELLMVLADVVRELQ